jgi:hypothetical protein
MEMWQDVVVGTVVVDFDLYDLEEVIWKDDDENRNVYVSHELVVEVLVDLAMDEVPIAMFLLLLLRILLLLLICLFENIHSLWVW